ncbi:MAG: hypothetical protein ACK2U5_12925 [Candidatus Promineifilaceae bacterium]
MATETQLHAIPLWLLREYLVETGGQAVAEDLVIGDDWRAKLEKQPPRQIGSLRVGIVENNTRRIVCGIGGGASAA